MLLFPFVFCYASSAYPEILLAVADFIHKEPLNYLTRPQIIYEPEFPPLILVNGRLNFNQFLPIAYKLETGSY